MSVNDSRLILKTAALSRAAPSQWSEFLAAFKDYSDQQATMCVQSPLETLQGAQGQARATALLLKMYQECRQRADKIPTKDRF